MKKANLAALLLAVTSFLTVIQAQEYGQQPPPEAIQPQPGVAHISLIHGEVSMQRGDSGDWAATTLNTPLVRGDQVATGEKSRTEIQLDYANVLRLAARSQVKIADLTRTRIQIQLAQGYANFSTFKGSEADTEIDTPNVAVRPLKHGRYRIQVNSDSETDVIVRDGEAEITTPQGSTTLKEGQQITVRGTDSPEYRIVEAPGKDDWDRWNKDRDTIIRDAEGWRRTNRYYTGVNDLDSYGHWALVPGYGWVWAPAQNVGWAPYQSGRWVWEPYYGWTWVSYEPWGWAPYHYGRWFVHAGYWYWWPGPVQVAYRPLWAPAYVAFIGFGHHVNFGFGFGSIGWLPCGPHDYFYPWYGRGFNRVHVTNIVNVTNVTNITNVNNGAVPPLGVRGRQPLVSNVNMAMTNPRIRQAITTVSSEDFGKGVAPSRHQGVDEVTLKQAQVVNGNLPVVPTRESLQPTHGGLTPATASITPRHVDHYFVKTQPPAGPPAFQDQANKVQDVIRAQGGGFQTPAKNGGPTLRDDGAVAGSNAGGVQTPSKNGGPVLRDGGTGTAGNAGGFQAPAKNGGPTLHDGGTGAVAGGVQTPGKNGGPVLRDGGADPVNNVNSSSSTGAQLPAAGRQSGPVVTTSKPAVGNISGPGTETADVNRTSGGNEIKTGGAREGWNTFGKPRPMGGPAAGAASEDSHTFSGGESERTIAQSSSDSQKKPGQSSGSTTPAPSGSNSSNGRGEWQKFGGGPTRSSDNNTSGARTDSQKTGASEDHGAGAKPPQSNTPVSPARGGQQSNENTSATPKAEGGNSEWHKFPSTGGSQGAKPPLSVDKPIVTPRSGGNEPRSFPGAEQRGGATPTPRMEPPTPSPRIEPRMSPPTPTPRIEPRMSPPTPAPRSEPRMSPPTPAPHSEPRSAPSGGGSNHGGSEPKTNSGSHKGGKDN